MYSILAGTGANSQQILSHFDLKRSLADENSHRDSTILSSRSWPGTKPHGIGSHLCQQHLEILRRNGRALVL